MPRCSICNDYETEKTSNFKRHVERCLRHHQTADATSQDTVTRNGAPNSHRSQDVQESMSERVSMASAVESRAPKRSRLTKFDTLNAALEVSSDDDEEWQTDRAVLRQTTNGGTERGSRLESTPLERPRQPDSYLTTPPPSKLRRFKPGSSIMTLSERDRLTTRIDELEIMVMKLQHAVCVMDSRMQQFRMATSSWHPIMADN